MSELLLLDFMFESPIPRDYLESDAYGIHMNVPYTHGLTSAQLDATLGDLRARGLVRVAADHFERTEYRLTAKGGDAWEQERCPVWSAYVDDFQGWEEDGTAYALVRATTLASAKAFVQTAESVGLHVPVSDGWTPCEVEAHHATLIYWKALPLVAFRAPIVDRDDSVARIDFDAYEAKRSWWRNMRELQRWHSGS